MDKDPIGKVETREMLGCDDFPNHVTFDFLCFKMSSGCVVREGLRSDSVIISIGLRLATIERWALNARHATVKGFACKVYAWKEVKHAKRVSRVHPETRADRWVSVALRERGRR